MKRIGHDLPSVALRLAKLRAEFDASTHQVRLRWRDAKGHAFLQQHTAGVHPTLSHLLSDLTRLIEIFEEIEKKVQDPDEHAS